MQAARTQLDDAFFSLLFGITGASIAAMERTTDRAVSILLQHVGHTPRNAVLIASNTAPPFQLQDGGRSDRGWHPSLTA